jgi:hypothetical protein
MNLSCTGYPLSFTEVANHFQLLLVIRSVGSGKQGVYKGTSTSEKGKKGGNDIYVDGVAHLGYRKDWRLA